MNRALLPACALAFATAALGGVSARDAEHRLLNEISIGGEGGWDYIIGDPSAHRLYVSHATQIVVADMTSGDIVGRIPDLPGVHGIALAPRLGRGFTSNGRANSSTIVDLNTLQPLGTVPTGANPDSIRYSKIEARSGPSTTATAASPRLPRTTARSSRPSSSAARSRKPSKTQPRSGCT